MLLRTPFLRQFHLLDFILYSWKLILIFYTAFPNFPANIYVLQEKYHTYTTSERDFLELQINYINLYITHYRTYSLLVHKLAF
jgi:hypothetical protein